LTIGDAPPGQFLRRVRRGLVLAIVVVVLGTAVLTVKGSTPAHVATTLPGAVDPALIEGPAQPEAPPATSEPKVVIIGDSHAWLWAERVPGVPDLGIPGALADQMGGQVAAALAMHPRYVVISAGTSDLNAGRSWASVTHALSTMVHQIKAAGATPVLLLIPQYAAVFHTDVWSEMGLLPFAATTATMVGGDQVSPVNQEIRGLGVPVLEAPAGETFDGVHRNSAAYAELNRQLHALTG